MKGPSNYITLDNAFDIYIEYSWYWKHDQTDRHPICYDIICDEEVPRQAHHTDAQLMPR